jgi:hypothetical protein
VITDSAAWATFVAEVAQALSAIVGRKVTPTDTFLAFAPGAVSSPTAGRENVFTLDDADQISLRVGTVAAVKGQTHDATLVLETNEHQVLDVAEALSMAFGTTKAIGVYRVRAVKNIFVGATRPRYALGLAVRREGVSEELQARIVDAGWEVVDLTRP